MYQIVVELLRPFFLVFVLSALGILVLWWRPRETRGRLLLVTVPFLLFTAMTIPALSHLALGTLEWHYPPLGQRPADAEAIVVLGSGVHPADATRLRPELDPDSIFRCLHAAELYRQGKPCPILVTGGKPDPRMDGPPCAELMRDLLLQLGVKASDLIVETRSRTTHENAVESAKLLEQRQLRRVVLVTDATHMGRAWRCFHKQGVDATPAPCQHRATDFKPSLANFLPHPGSAGRFQMAFHEWLGLAWYWWHDRI
jgi:uncharacterized SAM-binding protein YcdF (DUF218 family)